MLLADKPPETSCVGTAVRDTGGYWQLIQARSFGRPTLPNEMVQPPLAPRLSLARYHPDHLVE